MHYIRISRVGKTACAVVLSCLLAAGPLMDSAPFYAFADEGTADVPATESDPARETAPEEKPQKHEQVNEDKPLAPDATQNQAPADKKPVEEGAANALPEGEAEASADGTAADVPSSPTVVNPDRVGVDVPLAQGEEVVATAGTVIVDGLSYVVNSDGGTATVAGCVDASAPKGDVIVAATVFSGSDEYLVTAVADEAFKDCEGIESIVLPDTLEAFGKDVFKGCSSLQRIEVGERSKLHAVHDGMLFDKELSTLLVCPEGKQPVASLPDSMTSFADDAFAGCRNLEAFQVEEGNQTFASVDGVLYSADRTRLVMAPARTVSVIVAPETSVIAAGAFSACSGLASIIANGYVETIEGKAFSLETLSKAMVALASGDDYDARKAVWDEAGFTNYIEPAVPGEIQQPAPTQSGFVYELLDDYTLAVSWTGENDPEADLVIPTTAKLDGVEYRVSAIAPAGFQGRQSLTSVQIRAPITAIGDDAFAGCTGLASVELSEGVSAIGAGAFSGTAVQRVVIPASVTSVGSRAFADCPDLSRIVTFSNAPSVAADAIAGCTGVAIYAPYNEAGEYSWNPGLVASGNHILPYGISLASDPLTLEVDETADLFEGGVCEVPEGCELTYSYAATPISVEAGQVTGKKLGTSEVTVSLSLDGVELGRSVRVVEVVAGRPTTYANRAYFRLMYDSNGGTPNPATSDLNNISAVNSNSVYTITDPQNKYYSEPAAPVKSGYRFLGWYTKDTDTKFDFAARPMTIPAKDVRSQSFAVDADMVKEYSTTLVAKWGVPIPEGATGGVIGGTNGADSVTWYITSDNELVITPTDGVSGTLPNGSFPWSGNSLITKVLINNDVNAGASLRDMFSGCSNLISIDGLNYLNTGNTTDMSGMFYRCSSLQSLDVSNLDTSKAVDLSRMFCYCSKLQSLDISKLNTSNAKYIDSMFANCSSLTSLDVSKLNTSSAIGMSQIFTGCSELLSIEGLQNFDTSNATNMHHMFNACGKITSLDVSKFVTSKVTNMKGMFGGCKGLESLIGIGNFNVSNVRDMSQMFLNCSKLTVLDVSEFYTSSAVNMDSMFFGCSSLDSLDLSKFSTENVTSMSSMFSNCKALASLDLSGFVTSNVTNMVSMLNGCNSLQSLDLSSFDTSNVTQMAGMFQNCSNLTTLNLSNFNTSKVTDMGRMFNGCKALQSLDISSFNTSNVTDMSFMFDGCNALQPLDVSKFVTTNVTDMSYMFSGCKALQSLNLSGFDTSKVTNMSRMFYSCNALQSLDVSSFNTSNVKNMASMFGGCRALQSLDVSAFKTPNVTKMSYMFNACTSLKTLDVTMLETSNVTDMSGMFYECSALQSLDLSKFDTSKVTDMTYMFRFCPGLSFLDLSNFNTTNVVKSDGMFGDCSALIEVKVGTGYTLGFLAQPAPGYNGNWTNSSGTSYAYNAIPSGVADTYKAELATYSITYELNGGTLPNDAPTSYTINSADITLPTPSLAGGEFLGWYESADFSGDSVTTIATGSIGDKTFYAKWKRSIPSDCQAGGVTGGVTWYITAGGELVLTPTNGVDGTMDEITTAQPAPWNDWKPSVLSLSVEPGVKAGKSISGAFSDCINLTSVDLSGLDTSNTETMSFLFSSCVKLPSIDLSVLNTSSAIDMYALLSRCESLTTANFSDLDTSKVRYMHRMFNECHSLMALDLSSFNTSMVGDADHMFYNCVSLESLDVSGWTISNASLGGMFENCSSLSSLDLSTWTVSGITDMATAFKGCASIPSLDLSSWDTSKATVFVSAFEGCSNLANVALPDGFVSASATDASKLFFDCPKLTTIPANLSFPESVPTAQAFGFSEAPVDFISTTYAGGDPQVLAYDWIADSRLLNGMEAYGELPTIDNLGRAWWSVDTNGTLTIGCEEDAVIADLGWVSIDGAVSTAPAEGAWSAARGLITKIVMRPGVAAQNAGAWFAGMTKLTDISQAYVPAKATFTNSMFSGCTSLSEIPEGFTFPASVTAARSMFRDCSSITSLPADFTLQGTSLVDAHSFFCKAGFKYLPDGFAFPENATNLQHFFSGTKLVQLPETLRLPSAPNLYVNRMFADCSYLETLPQGFTLVENCVGAEQMFQNCSSLKALPEGFSIPQGTDVNMLLYACPRLTSLPASFKLNSLGLTSEVLGRLLPTRGMVPTYYAGNPDDVPAVDYWATTWDRQLITAGSLPTGVYSVEFKLPDTTGAYSEPAWFTGVTGADGILGEVSAPTREGHEFIGWFVDEACTIAFDFSKSVTGQAQGAPNPVTTLYARYTEARSTLPTTDGGEHASWELTRDGTLDISCEDGYTIADLGWEPATSKTDYWGPVRSKVKRVQMDANVKAESMACWFMSMTDLTDVSGVFVPKGVASVSALFSGCSSLTGLPDGFVIPEGVWNLDGMMNSTPKLEGLPDGFHLPESAEIVAGMFESSGIQSLPAGFTITKNVTDTRWMFQSCHQLTELPEGFQLPMDGKLEKAKNMFNMATGLKSIPVGYKIPASVTDCSYMFGSCRALTTIPEGFTLPSKGDLMAEYLFQSCNSLSVIPASLSLKGLMDAGWDPDTQGKEMFMVYSNQSPVISTLYMGKASDMPEAAWWKKQRRTLYFADDPDNPLPSGMKTVTFKTASLTTPGQWDDYATMLTDESGKLTQPGDPQAFGYPFKGWYTNEACTAKFDFSKQITADDVVVYGAFGAPILRGTVPLEANVVVDNAGGSTTASAEIRSFTPVDIDLTSVSCETGPGIAELFPNEADRTKPFAMVKFPDQAEPVKASFTGQPAATSVTIPLSTGWTSPGTKDCDISLDLNGAQVKHRIEDYAAQVANIVWTVEVKK